MDRLKENQLRMWRYKRGWQITINSDLSRAILVNDLVHMEMKVYNNKTFFTFSKIKRKKKKNVSVSVKGKNGCNAYIRLQEFLETVATQLALTASGSYILTLGKNTSKMENLMTFQILKLNKVGETEEAEETTETSADDAVNHPAHYTSHPSGVECITITRHYCFSIGNAIKYLWRAGLKQDADKTEKEKEIEDLEKAVWYINDRIKQLKGE